MEIKKTEKTEYKYKCNFCNYKSNNKTDYNRHNNTIKHKSKLMEINGNKKTEKNAFFHCSNCNKIYKNNSGLWKHEKKCIINNSNTDNSGKTIDYKCMFLELINENKEMRNMLLKQQEQISELIPKVGNNNNNNNIKQKFNINVFLNEKCKDALSMDEFIDKIEVSMKNLLTTKEKGQVNGISNIIMENMNKLSLYERPLHCTDKKRETLYVKNDKWEKDDGKIHINKALKKIESKQLKNLNVWLDEHPNYMNNSKEQEEFAHLMSECGKSIDGGREKIIKKLCDNVYIEKVDDESL
jgi:hypothetical protein